MILLVTIMDTGSAQGIRNQPVHSTLEVPGGTITAIFQTSMVPIKVLQVLSFQGVWLGVPLLIGSNSLK